MPISKQPSAVLPVGRCLYSQIKALLHLQNHVDPSKRWLRLAHRAVAAPCFVQALGLQRSPLRLRDPVAGGAAQDVRGVGQRSGGCHLRVSAQDPGQIGGHNNTRGIELWWVCRFLMAYF